MDKCDGASQAARNSASPYFVLELDFLLDDLKYVTSLLVLLAAMINQAHRFFPSLSPSLY
jgi:hypothetical protein